jgi:hypothetical protein
VFYKRSSNKYNEKKKSVLQEKQSKPPVWGCHSLDKYSLKDITKQKNGCYTKKNEVSGSGIERVKQSKLRKKQETLR